MLAPSAPLGLPLGPLGTSPRGSDIASVGKGEHPLPFVGVPHRLVTKVERGGVESVALDCVSLQGVVTTCR